MDILSYHYTIDWVTQTTSLYNPLQMITPSTTRLYGPGICNTSQTWFNYMLHLYICHRHLYRKIVATNNFTVKIWHFHRHQKIWVDSLFMIWFNSLFWIWLSFANSIWLSVSDLTQHFQFDSIFPIQFYSSFKMQLYSIL